MSNNLGIYVKDIADAIRTKTGSSSLIDPQDFPTEIENIPSGGTSKLPQVVDKTVTTITAEDLAGATSIGNYAFFNCQSLTSITIPDSVTSIGDSVFPGCTGLTSITIPDSVTSIGYGVFNNCTSLTSVNIGNSVTSIGNNAFSGCTRLTSINIPDSVTSIGQYVFSYCSGLTSITIPDSVTSIGSYAFNQCYGLASVTVLRDSPPTLGTNAFNNTSPFLHIYVPAASVSAYQAASGWSTYASRIQAIPS